MSEPHASTTVSSDPTAGREQRRRRLGRPATMWAALGYLAVAALVTARAWGDPANTWIGTPGDPEKFMGFLAWFPFAVTHGLNPLHMTYVDLPTGINAMWDGTVPFAAYAVWPARALFGPVAAYDVAVIGALLLDGLGTFLWLRRHTRHQVAAFVGGLMMVVGPYALARTYGHLNLVLFFALPFMFLLLEDIVREPEHRLRRGFLFGALAAVQLLCGEEPLALGAIALAVALAIAAATSPRRALSRAMSVLPAGTAALAGFLLIGGVPLGYQFLGPDIVHGVFQPPDVYVTDLANLVVPTTAQVISLGGPGAEGIPAGTWTGGPIEWDGYIGVPLLLLVAFALVHWRRDRWLLIVGCSTVVLTVLSLGPHLHVNGVDHTRWPLPEAVIDSLPVFKSILPNRFSLVVDFGLAAVIAVFIDRVAFSTTLWRRAAGVVATAVVAASMWPALVPASNTYIPPYFRTGGDVADLSPASAALVFPIPFVGSAASTSSALWQAVADFRFKMFSGATTSATSAGTVGFGSPDLPLRCVTDELQGSGSTTGCNLTPPAFLARLRGLGIRLVIVGPVDHLSEITAYMTALTGRQPQRDQGVLIWPV